MAYDAARPDVPWLRFRPAGPPYADTLSALDETMGLGRLFQGKAFVDDGLDLGRDAHPALEFDRITVGLL